MALTLSNRRWYPYIFLLLSTSAVAAWLRFAPNHPPELLISVMVGIAGIIYFLYRQHLDETKLFKDLFADFNSRYDALNEALNSILGGSSTDSLAPDQRDHLFSFFNLCAEEYFFYTAGYIDQRVWDSWGRGMKVFFQNPRIQALWEQDCNADSYYGFIPPK